MDTTTDGVFLGHFLHDPGPIKLAFSPARYTTSTGTLRGCRCLHAHLNESRTADRRGPLVVASPLRSVVLVFLGFGDLGFLVRLPFNLF